MLIAYCQIIQYINRIADNIFRKRSQKQILGYIEKYIAYQKIR